MGHLKLCILGQCGDLVALQPLRKLIALPLHVHNSSKRRQQAQLLSRGCAGVCSVPSNQYLQLPKLIFNVILPCH